VAAPTPTTAAVAAAAGLTNPGGSLNDGLFSLGLNMEVASLSAAVAAAAAGGGQQNAVMTNNSVMNALGSNVNDTSNTFSADELKQMLALQQQLLVQQQHMQQQQHQQGMLQQLAAAASVNTGAGNNNNSSLPVINNTLTAANNPATLEMTNVMGGGASNFWNSSNLTSGIGNMGGNINGIGDGFTLNTDGILNNMNNFQTQQQQAPVAAGATNNNYPISIETDDMNPSAKKAHRETFQPPSQIRNSVASHLPLLQLNNPNGAILRSYYELSTNDVLNLPPIPTDEEYCTRVNIDYNFLPTYDKSALQAARFSELALGALANNQISLALELSNSSVMCLRNCVSSEETSHTRALYNVARAYLLHGIFRSFRGDMARYFKYRRVCMTHILQMNDEPGPRCGREEHVEALLAAISFHDSWAYLMHNASEDSLPDIDESLPNLNNNTNGNNNTSISNNGGPTIPSLVATNPINQMWMQGSPQVFLDNEASLVSRSLDAFACAVRTCCDQANCQFEDIAKTSGLDVMGISSSSQGNHNDRLQFLQRGPTPTTAAVMANENELCSRNIVLSAKSLLDQHFGMMNGTIKKHGLYMVASVMSAFLENGEMEDSGGGSGSDGGNSSIGGFTDRQIKNLLAGCDVVIQHPLLLHCPGPIYHMASNAAILLCHLLNGIHAKCGAASAGSGASSSSTNHKVEGILFDEVLDTFMAIRKALNIHRKSLPVKLRCHGIPRPSGVGPFKKISNNAEAPFIDLGDTLMCLCRGCQNFVIMGCSPCVAAERSMKAALDHANQEQKRTTEDNVGTDEFDRELEEMDDLSLDDDALLDMLSRIVQN